MIGLHMAMSQQLEEFRGLASNEDLHVKDRNDARSQAARLELLLNELPIPPKMTALEAEAAFDRGELKSGDPVRISDQDGRLMWAK